MARFFRSGKRVGLTQASEGAAESPVVAKIQEALRRGLCPFCFGADGTEVTATVGPFCEAHKSLNVRIQPPEQPARRPRRDLEADQESMRAGVETLRENIRRTVEGPESER